MNEIVRLYECRPVWRSRANKDRPHIHSVKRNELHEVQASEAKLMNDGEAERKRRTGLMNFALRNLGVWTLRRGCCLSIASFTPFSSTLPDFSKIRAALIFCFFCIKAKEKAFY